VTGNPKEAQRAILKATTLALLGNQIATLARLKEVLKDLQPMAAPDLDESDIESISIELEKERIWDMGEGISFASATHIPWLESRREELSWQRWNAYRALLVNKGLTPKIIDAMSARNDRILDLAGDPKQIGNWSRRGLVIGDVQSGKTANYLGLFNKAADAGYKVFILLGGHTDKLRQQTQARVDEGFIGRDTRMIQLNKGTIEQGSTNRIGIGISSSVSTDALTSYYEDFSVSKVGTVFHVDEDRPPVVFVIKKNKTILQNLTKFLSASLAPGQRIEAPALLLDDEADYASINTKPGSDEATAINAAIRDLLRVFERNSYIGYTATPFANVLIDDENEDDLFPRNFIYSLDAPGNYFGPRQMFGETAGDTNNFIQPLYDAEGSFPFKHKSDLNVGDIPSSLLEAIRVFFLTNAIRDLRPLQENKPRSMLVNVSRFVRVQQQIFEMVSEAVSNMRDSLSYERQSSSNEWTVMRNLFESQFASSGVTWEEVRDVLVESVSTIAVHIVNSKKGSATWDAAFDAPKPRVIAIGGDYLSRGLTLEGLCTSYFYRRSLAYDTLMQMGRWFGYRDGYQDLCRLWIDDEVALWFRDIADAIDELRFDLAEMANRKLEPKDFGLAVRCHPGAMMTVTARNKSLSGTPTPKNVSLWNKVRETSRLSTDSKVVETNYQALENLITEVQDSQIPSFASNKQFVRTGISQRVIASFLDAYTAAETDPIFSGTDLASFIRSSSSKAVEIWDVILMGGEGVDNGLGQSQGTVRRKLNIQATDPGIAYVSGSSRRLGGSADISQVLPKEIRADVKSKTARKLPSADEYSARVERPVLILYPLEPVLVKNIQLGDGTSEERLVLSKPLVGVGIAFPKQSSTTDSDTLYMANTVWKRLMAKTVVGPVQADEDEEEVDVD
jgi:hypothetical protein